MYIYHLKPSPFFGTSLIPLNSMDKDGELYKKYVKKYIGREDLMDEVIPLLDCKWNDVVQFSSLDPQKIVDKLKTIEVDLKINRIEYFKIHIDQIITKYDAVIFNINGNEARVLDKSYGEICAVPNETIEYWLEVKNNGGKFLWFQYIPHIMVKGEIDTSDFEVCHLTLGL